MDLGDLDYLSDAEVVEPGGPPPAGVVGGLVEPTSSEEERQEVQDFEGTDYTGRGALADTIEALAGSKVSIRSGVSDLAIPYLLSGDSRTLGEVLGGSKVKIDDFLGTVIALSRQHRVRNVYRSKLSSEEFSLRSADANWPFQNAGSIRFLSLDDYVPLPPYVSFQELSASDPMLATFLFMKVGEFPTLQTVPSTRVLVSPTNGQLVAADKPRRKYFYYSANPTFRDGPIADEVMAIATDLYEQSSGDEKLGYRSLLESLFNVKANFVLTSGNLPSMLARLKKVAKLHKDVREKSHLLQGNPNLQWKSPNSCLRMSDASSKAFSKLIAEACGLMPEPGALLPVLRGSPITLMRAGTADVNKVKYVNGAEAGLPFQAKVGSCLPSILYRGEQMYESLVDETSAIMLFENEGTRLKPKFEIVETDKVDLNTPESLGTRTIVLTGAGAAQMARVFFSRVVMRNCLEDNRSISIYGLTLYKGGMNDLLRNMKSELDSGTPNLPGASYQKLSDSSAACVRTYADNIFIMTRQEAPGGSKTYHFMSFDVEKCESSHTQEGLVQKMKLLALTCWSNPDPKWKLFVKHFSRSAAPKGATVWKDKQISLGYLASGCVGTAIFNVIQTVATVTLAMQLGNLVQPPEAPGGRPASGPAWGALRERTGVSVKLSRVEDITPLFDEGSPPSKWFDLDLLGMGAVSTDANLPSGKKRVISPALDPLRAMPSLLFSKRAKKANKDRSTPAETDIADMISVLSKCVSMFLLCGYFNRELSTLIKTYFFERKKALESSNAFVRATQSGFDKNELLRLVPDVGRGDSNPVAFGSDLLVNVISSEAGDGTLKIDWPSDEAIAWLAFGNQLGEIFSQPSAEPSQSNEVAELLRITPKVSLDAPLLTAMKKVSLPLTDAPPVDTAPIVGKKKAGPDFDYSGDLKEVSKILSDLGAGRKLLLRAKEESIANPAQLARNMVLSKVSQISGVPVSILDTLAPRAGLPFEAVPPSSPMATDEKIMGLRVTPIARRIQSLKHNFKYVAPPPETSAPATLDPTAVTNPVGAKPQWADEDEGEMDFSMDPSDVMSGTAKAPALKGEFVTKLEQQKPTVSRLVRPSPSSVVRAATTFASMTPEERARRKAWLLAAAREQGSRI